MSQEVRAIYENGLFRPLDPVALAEHDLVSIVVSTPRHEKRPAGDQAPAPCDATGVEFDDELESLLFDGPSLPADFSRADVYADHD
jgi:hypothetical protein